MLDAPLLAGAAGVVVGAALTLVLVYARRFALAPRDLGSDAERATHRTLHVAAAAAAALRGGRDEPDAARAAKHLRVLLAADAVAIVESGTDRVAVDGPEALAGPARRIATRVYESGRRQVFSEAREAAGGGPVVFDLRV